MTRAKRLICFCGMLVALVLAQRCCLAQGNVSFERERMYVDGKPFLYWGFIWRTRHIPLEMMKQFRFNAVLGKRDREEADRAAELGIYLMAPHTNQEEAPQAWLAEHPATIAWFMMDDANSQEQADKVAGIISQIRKVDPVRPTLVDLNGRTVEADLRFVDLIDIYAPYAYPLPTKGYRWYFYDFLDHLRQGVSRKYLWTAMQCSGIYSFHARAGYTWADQLSYPTPGQFRLLCWGSVAHGVRGFMFWPIQGLLPPNDEVGDRTAEAMIIAHEFESIGEELVAGEQVPGGAHCTAAAGAPAADIDVGRIDLADHTILIASVLGDNYEWAMDEATADVEIALPRPPQLDGELRAYSFGFPGLEDVPLRQEGDQIIVGPHRVEISDVIVIEEAGACRQNHAAGIREHLPAAAAAAQSLLRYLHAKMDYVHRHLVTLSVDVPAAQACYARAVRLKERSAAQFKSGHSADSFVSARDAQRNYRQMLWEYREYAEQFRDYAASDMQLYLRMPYGLPLYFASFDHTAVAGE